MRTTDDMLNAIKAKGVMRASELSSFVSTRTQLRRYVDSGFLIALGSGIYAHPELDPFTAAVVAVARYYPSAVISNVTAMVIHGLSDERIDRIDVDIPRDKSIRNKLIRAHRVAKEHIVGLIHQSFHGHKIQIYTRERTLCDAYHLDPEGPLFLKAIKRYVKSKEVDSDTIAFFDKVLKTNVLRSLTQELADE